MVTINKIFKQTKTKTKFVSLLLFALLLSFGLFGLEAKAETLGEGSQRVFDEAALIDEDDIEYLEILIAEFREETGMDFVFLTSYEAEYSSSDSKAERIGMAFADDFYDYNGFGSGEDNAGLIYFIDMSNRMPIITTTGITIDYITDSRLATIFTHVDADLREGDYVSSVVSVLQDTAGFVEEGIPDDQYRYDIDTGEIITKPTKIRQITLLELFISAFVGLIVAVAVHLNVKSQYGLLGSTYRYNIKGNSKVNITDRRDEYIRTSVVRTPKPKPSSSSSGGGSGTHSSSSGTSHGGGGGSRF